jgi:hypothetical protein
MLRTLGGNHPELCHLPAQHVDRLGALRDQSLAHPMHVWMAPGSQEETAMGVREVACGHVSGLCGAVA